MHIHQICSVSRFRSEGTHVTDWGWEFLHSWILSYPVTPDIMVDSLATFVILDVSENMGVQIFLGLLGVVAEPFLQVFSGCRFNLEGISVTVQPGVIMSLDSRRQILWPPHLLSWAC